jgi:hypothetical protein
MSLVDSFLGRDSMDFGSFPRNSKSFGFDDKITVLKFIYNLVKNQKSQLNQSRPIIEIRERSFPRPR